MEKILSIAAYDLNVTCRLCLTTSSTLIDIFRFSTNLCDRVADAIMKCAPVQIKAYDAMPNIICRPCYIQLKKIHQFQMQVVQSDKTLRRYIQTLQVSDKQTKLECVTKKSSDAPANQNSDANITVKCEPSEISDTCDEIIKISDACDEIIGQQKTANESNIIGEEIYLKSEIKDEPTDDRSLDLAECTNNISSFNANGSEINSKETKIVIDDTKVDVDVSGSFKFNNVTEELNYNLKEMCNIPMKKDVDNSSLLSVEYSDSTTNTFSNIDGTKTRNEDRKINVGGSEIVKNATCHASNKDMNRIGNPAKSENLKKKKARSKKVYQCDICKIHLKSLSVLKKHKLIHTGEKPFQCDICKMCFRQSDHLKRHNFIHTGEKPYQCDICKVCFRESNSLKKHYSIHTGEKPYQCDVCKQCFRLLSVLKKHKLVHTEDKPYKCEICKKCFRESALLKKHNLVHTGEKPYQCDACEMCFRDRSSLKKHHLIHTGEKPYECDVCKQCFRLLYDLKKHKLMHTGEKPFQCDFCKRCFIDENIFEEHKLTHTGEKPYQCDICKMYFRLSGTLRTHKFTHTGEKPYQCNICEKFFRQSSTLKKHILIHK